MHLPDPGNVPPGEDFGRFLGLCRALLHQRKVVWNQSLEWLVKTFSTGLPPENVDSRVPRARQAADRQLLIFCHCLRRWAKALWNQWLVWLAQRFSTGLLPKNVDIRPGGTAAMRWEIRAGCLHIACAVRRRGKKRLCNQGLGRLVKALSTSLPPESVDKGLPGAGPAWEEEKLGINPLG